MRAVLAVLAALLAASCGAPAPVARASAASCSVATPGVVLPSPLVTMPGTAVLSPAGPDVLVALMNGEFVYRSLDAGCSWQRRGDVRARSISFVSADEGWALAPGSPATQCQAQSVTLYHTVDGGLTWTPALLGAGAGPPAPGCKTGATFADAERGFLPAGDPNHRPVVYRTLDGGRTWLASAPLPDPPGFTSLPGGFTLTPREVAVTGAALLLAATEPAQLNSVDAVVFRSDDGGATWRYVGRAPLTTAFLSSTHWLAIGASSGQAEETLDAGTTWEPVPSDYSQAAGVAPIVVAGDQHTIYATVRGEIRRTQDGGRHWTLLATPGYNA